MLIAPFIGQTIVYIECARYKRQYTNARKKKYRNPLIIRLFGYMISVDDYFSFFFGIADSLNSIISNTSRRVVKSFKSENWVRQRKERTEDDILCPFGASRRKRSTSARPQPQDGRDCRIHAETRWFVQCGIFGRFASRPWKVYLPLSAIFARGERCKARKRNSYIPRLQAVDRQTPCSCQQWRRIFYSGAVGAGNRKLSRAVRLCIKALLPSLIAEL